MSYDFEGRNFTDDVPTLKGSDLKLDWSDTGRFFNPVQESDRTLDAVSSFFPTFDENKLDVESETEMLKDTGIKSTGSRTFKEVENILHWRKRDERLALDVSRTDAPGFAITAQFASAVFNPVEVAVGTAAMFVPGLGPSYAAARIAAKGTRIGRMLEGAKVGAIQNTAVGIGFEPLNYAVETHYGHEYGITDSLVNVAANTVFGGIFGGGVQGFSDRKGFSKTYEQRVWDKLPQSSKHEIIQAVSVAVDNNVPLKTGDIIKIARTDRFFRYASKEGEGNGGFYDKVRTGFLEKVFIGRPELEAAYHELNLNRITKGKHSVLSLEYKPEIPTIEPKVELPVAQLKKTKQPTVKETKQLRKVVELGETLHKTKLTKKQQIEALKSERDSVMAHNNMDNQFNKLIVADIDKKLTGYDSDIKNAKKIFNDELDKLDDSSQQVLSIIQGDKPILRSHKKILNEVMKVEHVKDNVNILSDLKTMAERDPLQPDLKHETPETPVETYDTTPENYEKLVEDMKAQVDEPAKKLSEDELVAMAYETNDAVELRNARLGNDLKEIDAEFSWLDDFDIGDCNG